MLDKFTFDSPYTENGYYKAEKQTDGKYLISWLGGRVIQPEHYVCNMITKGYWKIKELDKPKNQFTIKQGQIEAAARFIVANNNYKPYQNIEQAINHINRTIKSMIERINNGQDAWYTATAGWIIVISHEDTDYYVVEVLVSPDVSSGEEFVNVEEIIN